MIIIINERIAEMQESDSDIESINLLTEFQEISKVQEMIFEDAEGFGGTEPYEDLLNEMAKISSDKIGDISSSNDGRFWKFYCNIDEKQVSFEIEAQKSEWLNEAFISKINDLLNESEKKFRFVNAFGAENGDQCFYLAFIDNGVLEKLQNHKNGYAFSDLF